MKKSHILGIWCKILQHMLNISNSTMLKYKFPKLLYTSNPTSPPQHHPVLTCDDKQNGADAQGCSSSRLHGILSFGDFRDLWQTDREWRMWDTEEEEVVEEEEEEKNVTGCGDNICQGNKRSYSTCSFLAPPTCFWRCDGRFTWQKKRTELPSGQESHI